MSGLPGTGRRPVPAVASETAESVALPGGSLGYTLRRSRRASRLRLVVDPIRGVIVTIPAGRPGARDAAAHVEPFLRERETWIRRHLSNHERERATVAGSAPEALVDGARLRYRGVVHALRVEPAAPGIRRSSVLSGWTAPSGSISDGPEWGIREIVVRVAPADRRSLAVVLVTWLRERAIADIDDAIERHAKALGVNPVRVSIRDPRTRWGSAARTGRLAFSWRLVLAPPEALETVVVHELAHLRVFGHGAAFWAVVSSRVPDHLLWRRWLREHSVELHAALSDGPPTNRA
ncbi:MAG: SprT family zinc-dependent metalloprotease [Chloroflexota bacterium]